MLASMAFATKNDVKNIPPSVRFDRLPVIAVDENSWYLFNANATDVADNELILEPSVGTGRWFKMNNSTDTSSLLTREDNVTSTYIINVTNTQALRLVLSGNTTLSFITQQRDGAFTIFLDRNSTGFNVTWNDTRLNWSANRNTPFTFNSGDNFAILKFFAVTTGVNKIYLTEVYRY